MTFASVIKLIRLRRLDEAERELDRLAEAADESERAAIAEVRGRLALLQGRAQNALELLTEARQAAPDSFAAAWRLARAAVEAGNMPLAIEALAGAVGLRQNETTLHALARARFRHSSFADAADAWQAVLEHQPGDVVAIAHRGFCLLYLERLDEAEKAFAEARALAPDWVELQVRYGDLLLRQRRFQEARQHLEDMLETEPGNGWVMFFLAVARHELSGNVHCAEDMEEAGRRIAARPDDPVVLPSGPSTVWFRAGMIWLRAGELPRAADALRQAVSLAPKRAHQLLQLGRVLYEMRLMKEAVQVLKGVRSWMREYQQATVLHGMCLLEMGSPGLAIKVLRDATENDPMDPHAFRELGRAHLRIDQLQQAEEALAAAFRIDGRAPGLSAAIHEFEARVGRTLDSDAGLADVFDYEMPKEFEPRFDEGVRRRPSLARGLLIHGRILGALILREMLTRYGQNKIGYVWAIVQPLLYVLTLYLIFSVGQRTVPLGVSVELFLVTGIVPVLNFFMNVQAKTSVAVVSSRNLLYFREVTPYSLMVAFAVLEFLTALTVFVLMLSGLAFFGFDVSVQNPLEVLLALVLISMLGLIVGSAFGLAALAVPSVTFVSQTFNRVIFFLSGAFYFANELPPTLRDILLLNPIFHLVEKLRDGMFVTYEAHHANWTYPLLYIVVGLLLMLSLERVTRRFVVSS